MAQAVAAVLARHPDIMAAAAGVKAAAARTRQAEARPDPILGFGTAAVPFNLNKEELRTSEIDLGLEQTFEFPGKRKLRVEIGRYGEDIASLELERTRLLLTARVRRSYLRVVLADRVLARIDEASGLLDRVIEAVQVQYAAGRAAYSDVLRARVDKARLRNRALEERRDRQAAAAELNLLLGRPASEPFVLLTGLETPPLARGGDEIKAEALAERPSLKIATFRAEQAAAAERLTGLNRGPDLTAGLFVPSKRLSAWGFSLGLTLPLSSKRWAGERAEAAAGLESSRAAADGLRRRLAAAIETAHQSFLLADEQVRVFEVDLLTALEDELKVSLDLYRYGKLEAFALIDLYRAAAEARLEHLRAVYNRAVALVDLDIAGEDAL
jgi:cobalt-zinc-cadmium efflux system outer membrane protein